LNPNAKKFGKEDPNELGICCSIFYIFAMIVKIGKIGSKFKIPFFGIKSLKKWLIK
jgi:hypothetical protein